MAIIPNFFSSSVLFSILIAAGSLFADATVIQSASPAFPLEIDRVILTGKHLGVKKADTLRLSLYDELRDNIDSVFSYADALRLHRQELSISSETGYACVSFEFLGLPAMKVFLQNAQCKSAKLSAAMDHYPYVVVFTKGFSKRLRKLILSIP